MLTWEDVETDDTIREGLYLMSGMAFITAPPLRVVFEGYNISNAYAGFNNGLFYQFPYTYDQDSIDLLVPEEEEIRPECQYSAFEITDPPPFKGYDCRCRPWYQSSYVAGLTDAVEAQEPYVYSSMSDNR